MPVFKHFVPAKVDIMQYVTVMGMIPVLAKVETAVFVLVSLIIQNPVTVTQETVLLIQFVLLIKKKHVRSVLV